MGWKKLTTPTDRKKGYNLCPMCKSDLKVFIDCKGEALKKKCVKGDYVVKLVK